MVALILEGVEAFILDLPATLGPSRKQNNIFRGDLKISDPAGGAAVLLFSGMVVGNDCFAEVVYYYRVLAAAQWYVIDPLIGDDGASLFVYLLSPLR